MPSWERLEEPELLLPESENSTQNSSPSPIWKFFKSTQSPPRRTILILFLALSTLLSLSLLVYVLKSGGKGEKIDTEGENFDNDPFFNEDESKLRSKENYSFKSLDLPEFSPLISYLIQGLSLFQTSPSDLTNETQIEVTVLYETLSLPSLTFLSTQFFPTLSSYSPSTLSPKLVPYGHANISVSSGREVLSCEHGAEECSGNLVHACAIRHTNLDSQPEVTKLLSFISCLTNGTLSGRKSVESGRECSGKLGLNWLSVYKCTSESEGMVILHAFRSVTEKLLRSGGRSGEERELPIVIVRSRGVLTKEEKNNFARVIKEVMERRNSTTGTNKN